MKSILDPSFQYTASFNTDLRKTFAKFRRAERAEAEEARKSPAEARAKVTSIALHSAGRLQSRPVAAEGTNAKESA